MKNTIVLWGFILLLALLIRCGGAVFWQNHFVPENELFYFGDSYTYYWLGEALAIGKPYQFDQWQVFRSPGYPLLIALCTPFAQCDSYILILRFENAIIGTLLVAAVGLLAWQLFHNRNIALLAAFFAAVDPCTVITNVWVLSETPFCLVIVLQLSAFIELWRSESNSRFIIFCVLFSILHAMAVYLRPSWLYFVPILLFFAFLYVLSMQKERWHCIKKTLISALIFTAVFSLLFLPWWVRNYHVTGRFVMTTLQMGASLYDGLNPEATGASDMRFVDEFRELEKTSPSGNPDDIYEYRLDQRMKQASIDWAKENPIQVINLACVKFFRLWNVWPNEPAFSKIHARLAIFFSYTPILIAGLLGLFQCRKHGFEYLALMVPAVYITLLHLIFVSSLRYRVPAMLFIMILAAFWFLEACKKRFVGSTPSE